MGQGESGFSGCRLGLPQLSPTGGACLLPRLPTLPLVCFSAPIPPAPFPSGEGGDSKFFLPGATAPGTPALNRLRHLQTLPSRHRRGGGACLLPRLPTLPLACFLAPYPPSPLPPGGEGGILGFLMQGASPLASPGAETGRHLQPLPCRASGGGLSSSPPANPAFSLLSCPLSPFPPSPGGEGGILSFLMQGAPPLASPGAEPGGTYRSCHAGHPAGDGFRVPTDHGGY